MKKNVLSTIAAALAGHEDLKVKVGRADLGERVDRLIEGAAKAYDCVGGCDCHLYEETVELVYAPRRPVEADDATTWWTVSEMVPAREARDLPAQRENYTYERIEALHGQPLYMSNPPLYTGPQTEIKTEDSHDHRTDDSHAQA